MACRHLGRQKVVVSCVFLVQQQQQQQQQQQSQSNMIPLLTEEGVPDGVHEAIRLAIKQLKMLGKPNQWRLQVGELCGWLVGFA